MSKTQIKDFTNGNITKQLAVFVWPLFLSNLLQVVYNMVDMMVGGNVLGKVGISAVSVGGDVDGDSAVDVIDAYAVSLVANGFSALENEYFLAADTNLDQEITVEDYSQVVNLVLSD